MAKWGEFDFCELEQFATNLKAMQKIMPAFFDNCIRELADRLLDKVVLRTPAGEYGDRLVEFTTSDGREVRFFAHDSRTGGTLRKSWTIGQVRRIDGGFVIEVINPVEYGTFVEYGHRTVNGAEWVEGRFMLTISEQELERELPGIIQRRLDKFFNDHLG